MPVLVPPAEGRNDPHNPYAAQSFHYDPATRSVTCPEQRTLDYQGSTVKQGVTVERYRCHVRDCPVRDRCTADPKGRSFEVRPWTPQVQAMRARLAEPVERARWARRREIIEPRFGQIKQHDGFRRWTVWGLEGVKAQWALICATLNLRILYRRWRAGREPEKASALGVLNLKARILKLPRAGPVLIQVGRWCEKQWTAALVWSRVRLRRFLLALASISEKNLLRQTRPACPG